MLRDDSNLRPIYVRIGGFSLLELMITLAIMMIVMGFASVGIQSALEGDRLDVSYRRTLGQMRRARQAAVDTRRVHRLTFTAPRTMRIDRVEADASLTLLEQMDLEDDIAFTIENGVPTSSSLTPDRFGTAAVTIDFNGGNQIFFQPDGSAFDAVGQLSNGVIYLARPGELATSRAVTLYGATGRIKGWRLNTGAWQ